jgi:hypothetical protein
MEEGGRVVTLAHELIQLLFLTGFAKVHVALSTCVSETFLKSVHSKMNAARTEGASRADTKTST